jgi:adenine-specific DNA-methyltransferase
MALELGAAEVGGPLSINEREPIRSMHNEPGHGSDLLDSIRSAIQCGEDPLGAALCRMRVATERRKSGTFYTPASLVVPMIDWALERKPSRIVDTGCGSGRFAAAVARRQPGLSIFAVDTDPLATMLTRAALAVVGCKDASVIQSDYTRTEIPRVSVRTAFVGNPPYVRHHDLKPETKAWAHAAALRLGRSVSALAGLHAYFFLATALHAQDGDIGCFVTSAEWLDVNYGALVRELLVAELGGTSLHMLHPKCVPFDDVMTTAAIATFQVGSIQDAFAFVRLRLLRRLVHSTRVSWLIGPRSL